MWDGREVISDLPPGAKTRGVLDSRSISSMFKMLLFADSEELLGRTSVMMIEVIGVAAAVSGVLLG